MEVLDTGRNKNRPAVLSACWAFQVMLFLVWTRPTALSYVIVVLKRLPLIGFLGGMIYPAAICLLILLAFPWLQRCARWTDVLTYLCMLFVVLVTLIIPWDNAQYLQENLSAILLSVLPMLFLGLGYRHERDKEVLYWASVIGVATMFVYQLYQIAKGMEIDEDSMDAAYRVLPSVMILVQQALEKKKLRYWVPAFFGIYAQFVYGTRGPILCIVVLCAVGLMMQVAQVKSRAVKLLVSIIILVAVGGIAFTDFLQKAAEKLMEIFAEQGFSTRIFEYFLEGDIASDNGRDILVQQAWEGLINSPVFGLGFMGDRALLNNYVHNIFIELLSNFGLILGTALIVLVVGIPVRAFMHTKYNVQLRLFVIMLIVMNFIKLSLSQSYIQDPQFFFMLGACLAISRSTKDRLM